MKTQKYTAFIALFLIIVMLAGCKSKSETLEENLIGNTWTLINDSSESGDMTFYKDGSAVCDWGLLKQSYEWKIEGEELTLIYEEDVFIYEVNSNDEGYIFTLIGGDHSAVYTSYDEIKLLKKPQ